ncbi:hypothetical protein Nepgr_029724 [Nepenthes gracilis]|uniref:Uncharacterized protein n=1 Tax=Nepenthes gracilis TaxID=150966 RepID=A0AAD3TEU7_NEPGR|nr:hypothetical protein Nepgr_029724 [Nepenthes gracilis]
MKPQFPSPDVISTSYDHDAPIDKYGIDHQPKWDHLKEVPKAIELREEAMVATDPTFGDVSEDDGVLSGSLNDEHANVVTTTDHHVLDVGAPCVADHIVGSLHRPLTTLETVPIEDESKGAHQPSMFAGLDSVSNPCHHYQIDGSSGEAISDEFGLIPGVDGSTPESIVFYNALIFISPCCSKAARVSEGPSSGNVAACVGGLSLCNPSDSPSCHLGACPLTEDELFARQQ